MIILWSAYLVFYPFVMQTICQRSECGDKKSSAKPFDLAEAYG